MKSFTKKTPIRNLTLVLASVCFSLLIIEGAARITGGIYHFFQLKRLSTVAKEGEFRILCIGESTTGFGFNNSYPAQLEKILKHDHPGSNIVVLNEGRPGFKTNQILKLLPELLRRHSPHIVVTMLGINDRDWGSLQEAADDPFYSNFRIFKILQHIFTSRIFQKLYHLGKTAAIAARPYFFNIALANSNKDQLQRAIDLHLNTRYREAEKIFYQLTETSQYQSLNHTQKLQAILWGGHNQLHLGTQDKALQLYDLYIENGGLDIHEIYLRLYDISDATNFKDISLVKKYAELAIRKNPHAGFHHAFLGSTYYLYARAKKMDLYSKYYQKAEQLLLKGFELESTLFGSLILLPDLYMRRKQFHKAETIVEKFLEFYEKQKVNDRLQLIEIWDRYIESLYHQKKYHAIVEVLETPLKLFPDDPRFQDTYKEICRNVDDCTRFQTRDKEVATQVPPNEGWLMKSQWSRSNYKKIIHLIQNHGVQAIVMQYPRRSIKILKNLFPNDDVLFISNQEPFDSLIKKGIPFNKIFEDDFGGNFGHATEYGNLLIAKNVATKIAEILK